MGIHTTDTPFCTKYPTYMGVYNLFFPAYKTILGSVHVLYKQGQSGLAVQSHLITLLTMLGSRGALGTKCLLYIINTFLLYFALYY